MSKKSLLVAVLFGILALVMVACAPAPAATEEPAVEEPAAEAPTEAPAEEPAEEPAPEFPTELIGDCEAGTSQIASVKALDSMTVEFTLCNPDPAFLSKIAFTPFAVQPAEWLVETGGTGELLERPIGTGPYMVEEWNRGESVVFTRFDEYWGEPAIAETLVFRWNAEAAARLTELQAGTVDGIDNPNPTDFEAIAANPDLQLIEREALNVFYVGFTDTFEPWSNVQVRQAIGLGIDRQRIVDEFYPAGSEVASHFTPCSIPNACEGEAWPDYDPEAARALLAEAGYPDGFETTIYYRDVVRGYLPEPGRVAEELQAQLAEIGITAAIEVQESGTFIENSTTGQLDGLYLLGWGADYPHITNFLDFHFGAANPQFGNPHPEIFELLAEGAQIADPAEAAPTYEAANNAIRELVPMVPIAHGGSGVAYRGDVENGIASPLGNEFFAAMNPGGRDTFVWMQNAEPISLFCFDETDGESLRACEQVTESLYAYEYGGTAVEPSLATECVPNEDLTVWTCALREGVKFHDGSDFDASDVIMSWTVGLDASSPLHIGNTGVFEYWSYLWGLINVSE